MGKNKIKILQYNYLYTLNNKLKTNHKKLTSTHQIKTKSFFKHASFCNTHQNLKQTNQ